LEDGGCSFQKWILTRERGGGGGGDSNGARERQATAGDGVRARARGGVRASGGGGDGDGVRSGAANVVGAAIADEDGDGDTEEDVCAHGRQWRTSGPNANGRLMSIALRDACTRTSSAKPARVREDGITDSSMVQERVFDASQPLEDEFES
jgi:hypothetical protein